MDDWLKKSERAPDAASSTHSETDAIEQALRSAPSVDVPFEQVLAAAKAREDSARPTRRWLWVPVLAAAAVALVTVGLLPGDPSRDRGAAAPPEFSVELAETGPGGTRAVPPGAPLSPGSKAAFRIHTRQAGTLRIVDGRTGQAVFPDSGTWPVQAGSHVPASGGKVLAYVPDEGATDALLEIEFCVDTAPDRRCDVRTVRLQWPDG